MLEPDEIAAIVCGPVLVTAKGVLAGKQVLVTAGPTREPVDPVRYVSNRSSGKMGYAIAVAAAEEGAVVRLVSGPVALGDPPGVEVIRVSTADEMYAATHEHLDGVDIFISAAAVSDYRPVRAAPNKIKKDSETMHLELVRTRDILASVAALDAAPFSVGFAAETENVRDYALGKLAKKNLNLIVANRVGDDCGFDRDENTIEVYWRGGERAFPTASKADLAHELVRLVAERYAEDRGTAVPPGLTVVSTRD